MWPFQRAKNNDIPTFAVENTLGAGTTVRGDVAGPGGFCVDGTVDGAIDADGPVIIGETGTVNGSVRGRDVVVLGRVRGDVISAGHLEIGPRGAIVGDITVVSFRMHKGGVFRGASRMEGAADLELALPPRATPETSEARGRTLPPADGGVPPPPSLAAITPVPAVPEDLVSQKRLVTLRDEDVVADDEKKSASG